MLTQDKLKSRLHYDPKEGVFTWLTSRRRAGALSSQGYIKITFEGRTYQAHRLAFLYMTGALPAQDVDHINCSRADNRWCNLQDVPRSLNAMNRASPNKNNGHGFRGVTVRRSKWVAVLCIKRTKQYLGIFDTPEAAHNAYESAKKKHFSAEGANLADS